MMFTRIFDAAGIASVAYLSWAMPAASWNAPQQPVTSAAAQRVSSGETGDIDKPSTAPDEPGSTELWRAGDGLFYVTALVNGQPVRFIVDTGASVTVLTHDDALRTGVRTGGNAGTMRTAGGTAHMEWGQLDSIEFAGRQLHGLDSMVTSNGLQVSLLGQNMLTKLGAVTIEGNHLKVS